jgi:hypothetical protein
MLTVVGCDIHLLNKFKYDVSFSSGERENVFRSRTDISQLITGSSRRG